VAIAAIINRVASLVSPAIGNLSFMSPAMGQPDALTKKQSDALSAYNNAVNDFESILGQRRAQIDSNQRLPNLPGQALYLARINMMSAYKDLTDAIPTKIGRPNKFGIPPAYFDAQKEPLVDECRALFDIMEAPPANAQKSATPFKDVVDLAIAIARARATALFLIVFDHLAQIKRANIFPITHGSESLLMSTCYAMKREQKIALGESRDCCRQEENSPGQALPFGHEPLPSSPRWPRWCFCQSR
jgi:hypothetical protein